jgi:hypothetical protein
MTEVNVPRCGCIWENGFYRNDNTIKSERGYGAEVRLRVSKTENLSKTDTNNRVFGDIRTRD